jgi:hypothetical protein
VICGLCRADWRPGLAAVAFGCLLALAPRAAEAHIKWFCAYDTSVPPLPIAQVLTPGFIAIATGFCLLMFAAFTVDRLLNTTALAVRFDNLVFSWAPGIEILLRCAVAVLFVALWLDGGTILTPELKTANPVVPWLQLAVAGCMIARATLPLAALGIMALYGYGVVEYGAFHMMDYPVIPALAAWFALAPAREEHWRAIRLPILYVGIALTMMWGAIEKFGYPYWTFPLLAARPEFAMGFRFEQFMTIAGFVEASIAFFMLTGTSLLRWSCALLLLMLVGAIPAFGKPDAMGHLPIIAGLLVMMIAGQRAIRVPVGGGGAVLGRASLLTAGYASTIAASVGLYYASQFLAGR